MKFLAILIAIFFYNHWSGGNPLRDKTFFPRYLKWFKHQKLPLKFHFLVGVGLPSLAVFLLTMQFEGLFLGLLNLCISLCVLVFAIEIYDDEADFSEQVTLLGGVDKEQTLEGVVQQQENFELIHIYDMFQSIVPILFWFILLGPAGSLFYVLSIWYLSALYQANIENGTDDHTEISWLKVLVFWLEWPAVLITGLIFALVGSFAPSIDYWLASVWNTKESSAKRLLKMAVIAIDKPDEPYGDDVLGFVKLAEYRVNELRTLCERSLYGWLGFAAIATIIGW